MTLMESELQTFLEKAENVHSQELAGIRSGKRMGTLQDIGIFLGPEAPAHIRNAKICEIINVEEFEKRALAMHEAQRTLAPTPAEPSKSSINPININRGE